MTVCFIVSVFLFAIFLDVSCSGLSTDTEILSIVKELNNTVQIHEHELRSLRDHVAEQENIIKTLQDKDKQQQDTIRYLMKSIHFSLPKEPVRPKQSHDNTSTLPILDDKGRTYLQESDIKLSKMSSLFHGFSTTSERLSRRRESNYPDYSKIAFQATLSADTVENIGIHQKIVFDSVNINVGGGYHPNLGVFIAPESGIYLFSTSILTEHYASTDVGIMKNGNELAGAYAATGTGFDQGAATVVVQLNVGDEIWVENLWPVNSKLHGHGKHTSFTGVLIVPV